MLRSSDSVCVCVCVYLYVCVFFTRVFVTRCESLVVFVCDWVGVSGPMRVCMTSDTGAAVVSFRQASAAETPSRTLVGS